MKEEKMSSESKLSSDLYEKFADMASRSTDEEVDRFFRNMIAGQSEQEALYSLAVAQIYFGRSQDLKITSNELNRKLTYEVAPKYALELWQFAKICSTNGSEKAAQAAARLAYNVAEEFNILDNISKGDLLEVFSIDASAGSGFCALPIISKLLERGEEKTVVRLLRQTGGDRPDLSGQRPLDKIAELSRNTISDISAPDRHHDAASLVLFWIQDHNNALLAAKRGSRSSLNTMIEEDVSQRLDLTDNLKLRAVDAPNIIGGRPNSNPPFIVVHTGNQNYVSICASSLAHVNGSNSIVLIGDRNTESIGIGKFAYINDYFHSAGLLAKNFSHQSVTEPSYGLFSFQRWLIVEEFCRKNRLDQCVVIDSDAIAFSSTSEILAVMPDGYMLNDWTWTTTVRDTAGLSQLSAFMHKFYDQPETVIAETAHKRGRLLKDGVRRSFQDMHMFYYFRDEHRDIMTSQYGIPHHGGLDQAVALPNGFQVDVPNHLSTIVPGGKFKKPFMEGKKLYFRTEDNEYIRFHTVHCQGPSKSIMHHYAALHINDMKLPISSWKNSEMSGETEKDHPTQTSNVNQEAVQGFSRAAIKLPNLKLPQHRELLNKIRGIVTAVSPIRMDFSINDFVYRAFKDSSEIEFAAVIRNDGKMSIPVVIDSYNTLQIGLRIYHHSSGCWNKLREERSCILTEKIAPGQYVETKNTISINSLAAGEYRVDFGLVYDYIRWVELETDNSMFLTVKGV